MTLDELTELKTLAAARERHLDLAERVETRSIRSTTSLFGMPMTEDLEDVVRVGMAAEYRRRAGIAEVRLRELGVLFPGDPAPGVEPSPKLGLISPKSWDPVAGTVDVWVSGTQAQSWRSEGQVYQVLRPQGLAWDDQVEVVDATDPNADWRECGTVVGCLTSDAGVMIRVRLDPYCGLMRGAVASGRISRHVGIGYDLLEQETGGRHCGRPLVTVHRWRLREIRLHRDDVQAEAA